METIILASGSPRRKEILERLALPFEVVVPSVDEGRFSTLSGGVQVKKLAEEKVKAALSLAGSDLWMWVLGLDTLVEISGRPLGKPADVTEAEAMLRLLSGKVHRVHTGISLWSRVDGVFDTRADKSFVKFRRMTDKDIKFYLSTGEWHGVAGAYRIQERGEFFIEWIKGSFSTIVGLPISLLYGMLLDNEYPFS